MSRSVPSCRAAVQRAALPVALAAALALAGACTSSGALTRAAGGEVDLPAATVPLPPVPADAPGTMFADARIAATASRSNFMEIEPSRLAVERAQVQAVRGYARMMIDEHTTLEEQMRTMLERKRMVPVDNAFSLQLQRNLPPTLEMLRARTGLAFDDEYLAHMESSHMTTLHTLDTSLIPEADDPELKTMLQNVVRPRVAAHLEQARTLRRQVAAQLGR